MKVLFYTDSTTYGGAERYLCALIKGLRDRCVEVALALPSEGNGWYKKVDNFGLEMEKVRSIRDKKDLMGLLHQIRFFIRSDASIIHFNLPNPYHSQFSILAAMMAHKPVVVTHHLPVLLKEVSWKGRLFEMILAKGIGKVIAVSLEGKKRIIEKLPFPCEKVVTIHNGIELPSLNGFDSKTIRREFGIGEKELVIGSAGRVTEQKGYKYLIMAARELKAKGKNFRIVIAGDGPLIKRLERQAIEFGIGELILFIGFVEDIFRFLQGIDIFILPSLYEGFPFAILEAMAAEKPVIATRVGGIPEVVIDGVTGLMIPPRDHLAISRAIEFLIDRKDIATEMGRRGRERVEKHFSSNRMVEKTLDIYKELVG